MSPFSPPAVTGSQRRSKLSVGVPLHIVAARLGDDPKTVLSTYCSILLPQSDEARGRAGSVDPGLMPSSVAIHEAGHAVVAVLLRRYFRTVSIIPDSDTAGRVTGWGEVDYRLARNRRRMAVIVYASFAAEVRYRQQTGEPAHPSARERDGFRKDYNALKTLGYPDDPDVIGESTSLVIEHWGAVLRVAEALDTAKKLTHKRVVESVMALSRDSALASR